MKKYTKILIAATFLVIVSGGLKAQSIRTAEQAKLPSNRPMPDKRILERKIETMRAAARQQQIQLKRAEQEKSQVPQSQPIDNRRILQPVVSNK
jgi:hypothetical protein